MSEEASRILGEEGGGAPDNGGAADGQQQQQQQQAEAVKWNTVVAEDGSLNDTWRTLLPQNLRGEKSLDSIKNVSTLAQSYIHAQRAVGANKVVVPNENSTPEEIAAFYKAAGRPDAADGYEYAVPEKLPAGVEFSPELLGEFRKTAHELGLSQKQFKAIVDYQANMVSQSVEMRDAQIAAEKTDTLNRIRTEKGVNFKSYIAQAEKALHTFGLFDWAEKAGKIGDYEFLNAMAGVGAKLSESALKGLGFENQTGGVQEQIDAINNDPEHPYHHRDKHGHDAAVTKMQQLLNLKSQAK